MDTARLTELGKMVGGSLDVVLSAWAEDTDARLEQLQHALEQRDIESARLCAHAIKGSSLNVGAARTASAARELEHALDAQHPDCAAASITLAKLRGQYENAARLIRERLDS
ncbi:Hpt domain-containing protein [Methyloversatilis thermotolerans]|uniref:Hpt domain-containing protein n=1 Tax=Methyloversatilis thermotolerans TaxID=1346290 RepID=UPI00039C9613|nr:Hpt domain-containing protein [Methyloversatilis thermotolerans]